jgi:hypothetical protein
MSLREHCGDMTSDSTFDVARMDRIAILSYLKVPRIFH